MSKKILAFLLTAIMVLSCLPAWLFTVSAEGELTATFMDGDTVVSTVTFTAGSKVRAPDYAAIKEGYHMLNWSYNDGSRNRTVSPGSNSEALNADTVFTANWVARNAESPAYSEGETDGVYTWEYDFQKATAAADVLPVNGTTNFNGFNIKFCDSLVPNTKGFNLKSGRIWEDTITLKSDNEVIYTFRVHTTHGCWFDIYINGTKIVQVKGQKVNALSTLSIKVNPETGAVTYLDPTDIVYSGTDEIVPVSYLSPASTAPVSQDGTMNFKFVGGSGSNNYIAYFSAQQITSAEPVVEYTASFEGEKISGIDPIGSFNGFVTLPMPGTTRLGYDFGGWSDGTTTYAAGDSVKLTADTTFTAVWVENGEPKYYTASFGGDSVSIAPITTESGDLTLPAAPTKEGYRFVGWSNGTTTYKASASAKISADTTFTAVWEEIFYYTATFTNVVTAVDPITVDDATQITLPQATKKGYVLVGWSDGTNTYKAGTKLYLVGDTTFTAVWETFVPKPDVFTEGQVGDDYVWNYELLNAPVMSDCTPTYGEMNPYGFNATNGLNLRSGNTWIDNYTLVSTEPVYFNISIFLASKGGWINFHVNGQKLFEQKANESNVVVSVAITFDPLTGEVTWGGNSATVPTNDDGTVTLGVIGGNGSGNCLQSVNVSQKMSDNYLAFFKGDMVSASTKVAVDSTVTAPYAENLLGWRFLGWSDGTTTYPAGSEITLTKNTVFVAVWETAPIYTVGFAGDKIVGYPTVQTSDTVVMPEVPFRLGYDFGGWSSDGGVTTYDVGEIVGVTADTTFTAVWIATGAPTSYTATFTNVEKPIAPIVTEVGPIVLPGMPEKEGYAFSGWSDGVVTYPAGAKITLVGDTTFSAVWYEIDENIIYQNSFTDEAAMNESTFDSGNNSIEHGRLLIKGYWE